MSRSLQESSLLNTVDYRSLSVGSVPTSEYLISTTVVGATPVASVEFDVSDYAGVYRHLKVVGAVRTTETGTGAPNLGITFNSDTAGNYSSHQLYGDGSTPISFAYANSSQMFAAKIPRNSETSGSFGAFDCDILDPFNSNKNTTIRSLTGSVGTVVALFSGSWRNTNAVTSIVLSYSSGNLLTGSRISLYGVTA